MKDTALIQFLQRAGSVAARVDGGALFGGRSRTFDLPASWAALITQAGGQSAVAPAGSVIDGESVEEVLIVRVTPIELHVRERDIPTQDGFLADATVAFHVSVPAERSDLTAFGKHVMGSYRRVTSDNLVRHVQPAIRLSLTELFADRDVAALMAPETVSELVAALSEAVAGPCFVAGLNLVDPPVIAIDSKAHARVLQTRQRLALEQREHEAARPLKAALSEARRQHLDDLATLLDRTQALAASAPGADLGDLLRTFSQDQRGELYRALFAAGDAPRATQWILVAAGSELLWFDAASPAKPTRRIQVEGAAGPVRSIQVHRDHDGQATLLLGAATGVYELPFEASTPRCTYRLQDVGQVRGGFNAVCCDRGMLHAAHSELGLVRWPLGEALDAVQQFAGWTRDAKAVRGVCAFEGECFCAVDDKIIAWHVEGDSAEPERVFRLEGATISALRPSPIGLFAGTSDGRVVLWGDGADRPPEVIHHGSRRAVESLWLLETHGVRRLIFTDTTPLVHAKVLGDQYSYHYEAGGQTLRRVEIAPDLIVATNDLRDRLLCWSPGAGDKPHTVIPVSQLCHRSVQDVCLV